MSLPNEQTVVRRALSLGALIARGEIENKIHSVENSDEIEQLERSAWNVTNWIEQEGLTRHLSRLERALINKLPGDWKHTEMACTKWRIEALGTLLWSLSYFEDMPPYDMKFNHKMVSDTIGVLSPAEDFAQCALLRPVSKLRHTRAVAELWHWRSRTRRWNNPKTKGLTTTLSTGIIREAAENAFIENNIPTPIEGDFPAFGKAYSSLTPKEHARMASIAFERHFAMNWLCGYSLDWDETPTDT